MNDSQAKTTCQILQSDHEKIEELLNQPKPTEAQQMETNLGNLAMELDMHIRFEEELFYPAVREVLKNKENGLDEFMRDNEKIKLALTALQRLLPDQDKEFSPQFKKLKRLVLNHFRNEEHDLLPKIRNSQFDTVKGLGYSATNDAHTSH